MKKLDEIMELALAILTFIAIVFCICGVRVCDERLKKIEQLLEHKQDK